MSGVGTELVKLLPWFKLTNDLCCWKDHVTLMDRWGVEVCSYNVATILTWVKRATHDLQIVFDKPLATRAIKIAIYKAQGSTDSYEFDYPMVAIDSEQPLKQSSIEK